MAVTKYYIDVSHSGLGKFQRVQGTDRGVVERRAAARQQEWDEQWARRCAAAQAKQQRQEERARRAHDRMEQRAYVEARKREAEELTAAAERAVSDIERVLEHTLTVDDRINFESLKDKTLFPEAKPVAPPPLPLPAQPQPLAVVYVAPAPSLWTQFVELFSAAARRRRLARDAERKRALEAQADAEHARQIAAWRADLAERQRANTHRAAEHQTKVASWSARKAAFEAQQRLGNDSIERLEQRYAARDPDAIEQHAELVLGASKYPDSFPQTFTVEYRSESRLLIVEYVLPLPAHLPNTKSAKYVQSKDEITESELSESAQKKLYDGCLYQIALRTLHELFEADVVRAVETIAFNGVVETIDGATGNAIRPCIISVQAGRAEFEQINLSAVDPRACFRKLKGIGSAQLHALAPVPPLVRFTKNDDRFVEGRAVLEQVDEGQNIACMPWEDFEHLIRDLFEREFSNQDADVRITRASRDGGVDAVIFDPDPIRGGKLVVQAKRYTNTVGVAAVRDLYGAMTAERASKGILVTTATFGHDSYEFARDKPITLLDGGGLLHLLQKHGVPARIDLRQAKGLVGN